MRKAESIKHLKSTFKEFFSLKQKSLFTIHDPVGVKLLSRLRLKFSHLNEQKFRHNFEDTPSPMCEDTVSKEIIVLTINFFKTTKRFERPLFDRRCHFMTTFFNFSSSFKFVLKICCRNIASNQFLQILIFPLFLNKTSQVLSGSKHIFIV